MSHNNSQQSVPNTTGTPNLTQPFFTNTKKVGKEIRSSSIPAGAEPTKQSATTARFAPTDDFVPDWRVKIKVPSTSTFRSSPILEPLQMTDWYCVFPVTPQIQLVSSANYDTLAPIHSNYPFPQYMQSQVEDMSIAGNFPVQSESDGMYWVAAVHFFRSLTKMFYGESAEKGSPPPLVKLSGYGDYVLPNVPVVVTNFSFDLSNNVDYLKVNTGKFGEYSSTYQMVPTNSLLSIQVKPTYSRAKVAEFNMDNFILGNEAQKGFI
tara:strand:- start:407 stop:1198 length:792 start_codon:yes stop_codon:yes gene_type:complete